MPNSEFIDVSQAAVPIGATGRVGDLLEGLLVIPQSLSPGAVTIKDGASGTDIPVFLGGANSVTSLAPFPIPIGLRSVNAGGWKITTGAAVKVLCIGRFT